VSERNPNLTLVAAAELMGVKSSWARDLLTRRHKQHPELGLLSRPPGSPRGNYIVDARGLREIMRGGAVEAIEDLKSRVGMLESDAETMRIRVRRIERKCALW